MTKAHALRALLAQKPILKVMGAHNALGAKLIEKCSFDAIWSSGFEIATAHGVPDANILTMTENLEAAQNIDAATRLPIICDCDTGYGNAINVIHMMKKYESAGMAAVVIEDKCFPKMNSFIPGRQELASIEEFVGKIEAAKTAVSDSAGIMVFARVEALIAGWGLEEAFRRAVAYCEAGADGIVIHSKSKTTDEIFSFAQQWHKSMPGRCPLIAIPTTYYTVTAQELSAHGFKMAIYANQGIRASIKSMEKVFQTIARDGTTRNIEKDIAPMADVFSLQGMHSYQEDEKRYSPVADKVSVVIPAAADHHAQPELSTLLQEQPLCMLEIAGKPLLQHQVDTLRSLNVQDFTLVGGYRQEKISVPGITVIKNQDFQTKKSAHSVMCGLSKTLGKTLLLYSDIIFDRQIPEALLKSPHPITIVIDRSFRSLPRRDKSLDLVLTEGDSLDLNSRRLGVGNFKKILRIGKKLDPAEAHYEFIGMCLLSKEGLEIVKNAWQKASTEFQTKPFYEATNADQSSMTDVLQYLIDAGAEVRGMIIEHGWSEIYSYADYERINRYFQETLHAPVNAPS